MPRYCVVNHVIIFANMIKRPATNGHVRMKLNIFTKTRAKLVKIIYKTDILAALLCMMVLCIFLHYLSWILDPPDVYSEGLSSKLHLISKRNVKSIEIVNVPETDIIGGILAVKGPNAIERQRVYGDIPNAKNMIEGLNGYDKNPLSKLAEIEQFQMQSDVIQPKQKLQIYENIRKLLHKAREGVPKPTDAQDIIRRNSDQKIIDHIIETNDTSFVDKWRKRQRHLPNDVVFHKSNLKFNLTLSRNGNHKQSNKTSEVRKVIEHIDQESEHLKQMEPVDRDKWLDEQVEEIMQLMFDNKKNAKNKQSIDLHTEAPFGSKLYGERAECTLYDLSSNINTSYECMPLDIKPPVTVCLYQTEVDIHISKHIREEGIWEPHIVKEFQNILFMNPDYGVIDIGANIGVYSLIAASMGHNVVSVEPFINNIKHFHQAVHLAGFADRITLVRNAIYEQRRSNMSLKLFETNQGGVAVDPNRADPCIGESCIDTVKTIVMDDLLEVINFRKAVIKIDIEGFEHRAFRHSKQLLDKVMISHIIMEWIKLRDYYGTEIDFSENKELTHDLVEMLFDRGFRPFSLVTGIELKRGYWYAWPDDIIWRNDLDFFTR